MKTKKLLFSAALLAVCSGAFAAADQDITPAIYNFEAAPVGQYNFFQDGWKGANPDLSLVAGYAEKAAIGVAPASGITPDATTLAAINAGCSIVQTSDGDKVLLIKGKDSQEAPSAPAATIAIPMWYGFNLFSGNSTSGDIVRCMSVIKNVPAIDIASFVVGKSGTSLDTGSAYTIYDSKWWPVFLDRPTKSDQMPIRIKLNLPAGFDGYATYIGLVKYTVDPTEAIPEIPEEGWDRPNGKTSGVENGLTDDGSFLAWDKQNIYVNNVQEGSNVSVFSISGQLVKSVQVTSAFMEIPMEQGIYIVKFGTKTAKVIL